MDTKTTISHTAAAEFDADEALVAFATQADADLAEWTRRHPAHARDLARAAESRWSGEPAGGAGTDAARTARLREIGLATVRACRPRTAAVVAAPLTSLVAAAKERGMDADAVAGALDLPVALFWKLHRRLIAPDSVPRTLVARLADTLNRASDDVAAYLRQPPTLAAGASYRSDDTPQISSQEDFADALKTEPEATDAHRKVWLSGE